jgi:hypothetical protein
MGKTIVSNNVRLLKDGYQTAHESLCAKLQQARTLAEIASSGDVTEEHVHRLIWCVSDLLDLAVEQCENLKPSDIDTRDGVNPLDE